MHVTLEMTPEAGGVAPATQGDAAGPTGAATQVASDMQDEQAVQETGKRRGRGKNKFLTRKGLSTLSMHSRHGVRSRGGKPRPPRPDPAMWRGGEESRAERADAAIKLYYSSLGLGEIAGLVGCSYSYLQSRVGRLVKRGELSPRERRYQPAWTPDEVEFLQENWGLTPEADIARMLGRTVLACLLKAKKLGLSRKQNFYTATDVAAIFGAEAKAVARWIECGLLRGEKSCVAAGKNTAWQVLAEDLEIFVREQQETYSLYLPRISAERTPFWYNLAKEANLGVVPPKYRATARHWTPKDDLYLEEHWGRVPDQQVYAHLGRSPAACKTRAHKLAITRREAVVSASEVARRWGVAGSRVYAWLAGGLLRGRKSAVGARSAPFWDIAESSIKRF